MDAGQVGGGDGDKAAEAGFAQDLAGEFRGAAIGVGGDDGGGATGGSGFALACLVQEHGPQLGVVLTPALKAPVRAGKAGSAVEQHVCRLELNAAARAGKVDEERIGGCGGVGDTVGLLGAHVRPGGLRECERCVVGTQDVGRARTGCIAREALEQRVAGKVEVQAGFVVADGEQQARVRVLGVDHGAGAGGIDQVVADGVLQALRREVRVAELIVDAAHGDRNGGERREDGLPGELLGVLVQILGIVAAKTANKDKYATGKT